MSEFQRYQRVNITDQHILITDVRQPNELQMIEHLIDGAL